ncbi:alpha/beta fold hydrolase [Microbacterium sp. DT81.1]|uniref:alpha/beta fold hydrolase n=1 Tax=Microbacterium sp. DT81.1 TaxID=3393413 RepID=UPI003CE9816E
MKLPYAEVSIDKKGAFADPAQLEALAQLLGEKNPTDVIVLSHGWNSSPAQARDLYEKLVESLVAVRGAVRGARARRFVIVGVVWPSIQWAPDESAGAGAGALGAADALAELVEQRIESRTIRKRLLALIPELENDPAARAEFLAQLRKSVPARVFKDTTEDGDAPPSRFATGDPDDVFTVVKGNPGRRRRGSGTVSGGAASVGGTGGIAATGGGAGFSLGGFFDAARNLVNITTFYTMKDRAGVVGRKGIAKLLERVHTEAPDARLHLVGHSFGGRAVTAAALTTKAPISSVTLLQAAYSHYGLARNFDREDWDKPGVLPGRSGAFADMPAKIGGPVLVSHTRNDKAVGMAYAIAARLAGHVGVDLGDANDTFGGMGSNGAQRTPGAVAGELLPVGGTYAFSRGVVYNVKSDAFIADHGAITGREVGYAVLSAVMS